MTIDGHPLTYRITQDKRTVFTILTGNPASPCSVLELDFSTHHATLQTLEHQTECFADGYENMRTVVRAAYEYAKRKGMRELFLTDQSSILCPDRVPLADLSFLTTGQTWYESVLPGLYCVLYHRDIEESRRRARAATWTTVGADLLPELHVDDGGAEGSAMRVLGELKKGREHCEFFSQNSTRLVARTYGRSLQGTVWKCDIPQDTVR